MKVSLGIVHGATVDSWFFHSIVGLLTTQSMEGHTLDDHVCIRSGPLLSAGRGQLVGSFLQHSKSDALLMLDSDQVASPATIYTLIDTFERARAEHDRLGILAGITYVQKFPRDDTPYPNIWMPYPKAPYGQVQMTTYPPDSLIEISAAGCSNMIIHREVLEEFATQNVNPFHHVSLVDYPLLAQTLPSLDDPTKVAETIQKAVWDADQWGEDLSFCARVRANNWRMFAHTGIIFDHSKPMLLGEPEYLAAVARHSQGEPPE